MNVPELTDLAQKEMEITMTELGLNGLSDAQVRLFAVRCARRVQHLMTDPRSIAALDVAERYAKGEATNDELAAAWGAAWAAFMVFTNTTESAAARDAAAAAMWAVAEDMAWAAPTVSASAAAWDVALVPGANSAVSSVWDAANAAEREAQQKILDEIKQEQPR